MSIALTRHPSRRRGLVAAAVISVGALVLSACSSTDADEPDGDGGPRLSRRRRKMSSRTAAATTLKS